MTTPSENDPAFDPFRYGRPEPGSPAAAAFPHLFDNPPPVYPGQANPPPHPGQPPPYPGQATGYPTQPPGYPAQPPPYPGQPPLAPPPSPYSAASGHPPARGAAAPPGLSAPPPFEYAPYGYPSPSGWAPPPATANGRAVAGFVLGLVALLLFWLTVLDLPLIVLGIVFSALGLKAARRGGPHAGMARAGLILAVVAAVAATVFTVVVVQRINACTDTYGSSTSQYDKCVRFQRAP